MAEKGGKGLPIARKKVAVKARPITIRQAATERKDNTPMEEDGLVRIDSSDSDSEGFVDGGNETPGGNGKAAKETVTSSKKASLDSLKTGVGFSSESPATKGDWGKGGKAFIPGKAGGKGGLPRASAVKPPLTEIELKLEMDIPKDARVLMDCEAAVILQGIHDTLTLLSDDPNVKMPLSFNKALEYCKSTNSYGNTESARQVLETLRSHGVTEGEICMIGNVCPETIEEVYALIPSLKANRHKNERAIREVLVSLATSRQTVS